MFWFSTAHLLQRSLVHTAIASHAFTDAAPTVWNSLAVKIQSADSLLVINMDSNPNSLIPLMQPRTVQRYHSAITALRFVFYATDRDT